MIRWCLAPGNSALIFSAALGFVYGLLPLGLGYSGFDQSFLTLGMLSLISGAGIILGAATSLGSARFARIRIDTTTFVVLVWAPFLAFAIMALVTADRIPLLASLAGDDPATISYLRERFLKAREGWQSSFVYINALFTGAFIPYTLGLMFLKRTRLRWWCFGFFLVYSLSFVEKTFFLKAMIPLIYLVAQEKIKTPFHSRTIIAAALALLLAITVISGAGRTDENTSDSDFVSLSYAPKGAIEHLAWRSLVIPVLTAADTIRVFDESFNGRPLLGATSSLLAGIFGMERVPLERLVFFEQWGQNETETGSSNSVFVTEAFVNFGIFGLIALSLVIGVIFNAIATSRDEAFRALWPLFAFALMTSGFIGVMASNGFLLLFIVLIFFKIHDEATAPMDLLFDQRAHIFVKDWK
jgi:hypothetical protein